MTSEVIAALITGGATVIAAIIATYIWRPRSDTGSTQSRTREPTQPEQLDLDILRRLVITQTNQYVSTQKKFSAWEVTLALRAVHQNVVIDHSEVRDLVHAHMQKVINERRYERETRHNGEVGYTLYVPAR